uniref:(northern house mosquito) hypothetical protein n=1 Tax=Culex pipiens TaxID=7175 RepID=A0A8D8CM26_CULPI
MSSIVFQRLRWPSEGRTATAVLSTQLGPRQLRNWRRRRPRPATTPACTCGGHSRARRTRRMTRRTTTAAVPRRRKPSSSAGGAPSGARPESCTSTWRILIQSDKILRSTVRRRSLERSGAGPGLGRPRRISPRTRKRMAAASRSPRRMAATTSTTKLSTNRPKLTTRSSRAR